MTRMVLSWGRMASCMQVNDSIAQLINSGKVDKHNFRLLVTGDVLAALSARLVMPALDAIAVFDTEGDPLCKP